MDEETDDYQLPATDTDHLHPRHGQNAKRFGGTDGKRGRFLAVKSAQQNNILASKSSSRPRYQAYCTNYVQLVFWDGLKSAKLYFLARMTSSQRNSKLRL
jgi:hypothetical protein